jgi:hypothetical protein
VAWVNVQNNPSSGTLATAAATSLSIGAFGSAVTVGNFVVVWAMGGAGGGTINPGQITCSDNAATPNTYTQLAFVNSNHANAIAAAALRLRGRRPQPLTIRREHCPEK